MTIANVYAEGRRRITELVREAGDEGEQTPVPSCPGWTVHDVVAHLSGVCADILAGNIAGVATDPWTHEQVEARRDTRVEDILDEWSAAAPQVEAFADQFPGRTGPQWVLDLTTHEHDIRATLGRAGARNSAGVDVGVEFLVTVGLDSGVSARGLPPLGVQAGDRSWTVGTQDPSAGDSVDDRVAAMLMQPPSEDAASVEPAATLQIAPFDLLRALTGRRSAAQIRQFDWSVDPEPYVPAFQFGPFTTSAADVIE